MTEDEAVVEAIDEMMRLGIFRHTTCYREVPDVMACRLCRYQMGLDPDVNPHMEGTLIHDCWEVETHMNAIKLEVFRPLDRLTRRIKRGM